TVRNSSAASDVYKRQVDDPNVKAAETKLMRRFGTNVKILPKSAGSGGRIEVEYYTMDDLDRIFQLMMKSE
ncbi:MAG: hypothetical protein QUS14_16125, partial [Pyrinomonadaceae bacterium]|nr:hypothetical protein [Pyrinomonadaceae bacterium]